jgi:hypothetical protein
VRRRVRSRPRHHRRGWCRPREQDTGAGRFFEDEDEMRLGGLEHFDGQLGKGLMEAPRTVGVSCRASAV